MAIKFSDIFANANNDIINNPKLEEFFSKTRDMAEAVGKKSAEHLELSRKRIEYLDAKTKLSRLYEKFGRMQYHAYIGETVDQNELDSVADRIAVLKEKADALNQEIEAAKAQFNDAVSTATKKTKDAFQKEFDKMNNTAEVSVTADEVDVSQAENAPDGAKDESK